MLSCATSGPFTRNNSGSLQCHLAVVAREYEIGILRQTQLLHGVVDRPYKRIRFGAQCKVIQDLQSR